MGRDMVAGYRSGLLHRLCMFTIRLCDLRLAYVRTGLRPLVPLRAQLQVLCVPRYASGRP